MPSPLYAAWPASTGLLISSIVFANKLWISDATSMSLYWVARLPIERPNERTSHARRTALGTRRQWKVAFSLAIVGALAAPFIFRTYKARPTYAVWTPLTAQQRATLATSLQSSNYCQSGTGSIVLDFICEKEREKFEQGGTFEYHPDSLKYLLLNVGAAAATFVSVFGLAFLIPMLIRGIGSVGRRYWQWLNA